MLGFARQALAPATSLPWARFCSGVKLDDIHPLELAFVAAGVVAASWVDGGMMDAPCVLDSLRRSPSLLLSTDMGNG